MGYYSSWQELQRYPSVGHWSNMFERPKPAISYFVKALLLTASQERPNAVESHPLNNLPSSCRNTIHWQKVLKLYISTFISFSWKKIDLSRTFHETAVRSTSYLSDHQHLQHCWLQLSASGLLEVKYFGHCSNCNNPTFQKAFRLLPWGF